MKAAIVPEHGRLELVQMSMPEPGPYDCLVQIDACAICTGTDSSIIAGHFPWLEKPPFVLGHESTGVIRQLGEKVRNFKIGQRVTRPAAVLPGQRRDGIGSNWGGFAEFGLVRDTLACKEDGVEYSGGLAASRVPLADDVDPVSAALSINQREILSVSLKAGYTPASRLVVIGSGYNGLLFSFFAKTFGVKTVVMLGNQARMESATSCFRADAFIDYKDPSAVSFANRLLGGEPTHVIDAIGSVGSVSLAKALLGPGTAFGRYGVHDFNAVQQVVGEMQSAHRAIDTGTDEASVTDLWYEQWKKGLYRRRGMCDDVVPLEAIVESFERLARREVTKIVVTMASAT